MLRVAVLSYESHQSCEIVRGLVDLEIFEPVLMVRSTVIDPRRKGLELVKFLGARDRRSFVIRKGVEVQLSKVAQRFHTLRGRPPVSLKSMSEDLGIPCFDCSTLRDEALLAAVTEARCDLLLSVHFNHIITAPWRQAARIGVINVHGSLLPSHRGLFPHFFALSDGDSVGGVTVHWVDKGIDTGRAISGQTIEISDSETVFSLANKAIDASIKSISEAIFSIEVNGTETPPMQAMAQHAQYHSWPTRSDMKRLKSRGRRYFQLTELVGLFRRPPAA